VAAQRPWGGAGGAGGEAPLNEETGALAPRSGQRDSALGRPVRDFRARALVQPRTQQGDQRWQDQ
jgi:hypothetical protein